MDVKKITQSIYDLHGVSGVAESNRNFFYDETNNYRKVYLRDGKFNFEGSGDFLLGGISLEKRKEINIERLKKEINLNKNSKEIKFKNIAKGDLLSVLKSRNLNRFLQFLNSEEIIIHFQRVNIFYWSIVDIVDSIVSENPERRFITNIYLIKDCLYRCLLKNKSKFIEIMDQHSYPDVSSDDVSVFYKSLIELISPHKSKYGYVGTLLIEILDIGAVASEAIFIQGEEKQILLKDFSPFYRQRVILFPNSKHFFDREDKIKKEMEKVAIKHNGNDLDNFSFVESHEYTSIQLSDALIGYLSKLYNFCKDKPKGSLADIKRKLNKIQLKNIKETKSLIDRAHSHNILLIEQVIPITDKNSWLELFG